MTGSSGGYGDPRSPGIAALRTVAGLMGAAGVILGAASAHAGGGGLTATASTFAVLHAGVLVGLTGDQGGTVGSAGRLAAGWLLVAGVVLFSGDLALLGLAGTRLFSGAAPAGGILLIGAWLLIAARPWVRATRS